MRTEQDAMVFFCQLSNAVREHAFNELEPADCFCGFNRFASDRGDFRFSDAVMRFIQQAVTDKLGKPLNITWEAAPPRPETTTPSGAAELTQARFEIEALQRRLAEYASEVQRLRSEIIADVDRYCIHHNDTERAESRKGCPVCLRSNFVDRAKAKQIAEALVKLEDCDCESNWQHHHVECPVGRGLIAAGELGLLEVK
jgi:hypothetical protein